MAGLIRDRLAYCDNCKTMRAFFEGDIPYVPDSGDTRPASDYVCASCYTIIATFVRVTPEQFTTAAQEIDDPDLRERAKCLGVDTGPLTSGAEALREHEPEVRCKE